MCKSIHPDDFLDMQNDKISSNLKEISSIIRNVGMDGMDYTTLTPNWLCYEFKQIKYSNLRYELCFPLYRGQGNYEWNLIASADRDPNVGLNNNIINYAAQCRLHHILRNTDVFSHQHTTTIKGMTVDQVPLKYDLEPFAQHYGFKTKCIDWTMDPGVAMFFACTDGKLGKCTPHSDSSSNNDCWSSVFIRDYRLIDEDSKNGPHIICPSILQRPYIQKGFYSIDSKKDVQKYKIEIDPAYCEEIAKKYDYGRSLTDHPNSDSLSKSMLLINDMKSFPEDQVNPLCINIEKDPSDVRKLIENSGLTIESWNVIDEEMPDLESILKNNDEVRIENYSVLTERCLDGQILTMDEAYDLFTSIELNRRVNNSLIDYLKDPDFNDFDPEWHS